MPSAFSSRAETYRALHWEVEKLIVERFSIEHGTVGAYRWRERKKPGFSEWRVSVYWSEQRIHRHRTLGKLADILLQVGRANYISD